MKDVISELVQERREAAALERVAELEHRHLRELLEACPDFVELLLAQCEGCERFEKCEEEMKDPANNNSPCPKVDDARRQCSAHSATLARWVERAISHLEELRLSRELVSLRLVDLDCVEAEPDPERAAELLRAAKRR